VHAAYANLIKLVAELVDMLSLLLIKLVEKNAMPCAGLHI